MTFFLALIPLCIVAITTTATFAEEGHPPPYEGSAALKTMKALAGTWEGTHVMNGKEVPGKN